MHHGFSRLGNYYYLCLSRAFVFKCQHMYIIDSLQRLICAQQLLQFALTVHQVEFSRGLVELAMEKMNSDVPELMYDDHNYSHLIDETLTFDRELRMAHGYPASQPGCLHVLMQPQAFNKWLTIERKCIVLICIFKHSQNVCTYNKNVRDLYILDRLPVLRTTSKPIQN